MYLIRPILRPPFILTKASALDFFYCDYFNRKKYEIMNTIHFVKGEISDIDPLVKKIKLVKLIK